MKARREGPQGQGRRLRRPRREPGSASSPTCRCMHQVVTAQLAARRAGTQSTKTRAEVRGGGAKPWRQKGTGRGPPGLEPGAPLGRRWRHPRPQAPQLRPEDAQEDGPPGPALGAVRPGRRRQGRRASTPGASTLPSTKSAVAALQGLGVEGRVLVVLGERGRRNAWKSVRNLQDVHPHPGPRAQRLRRAGRPTGWSSPARPCRRRSRSPPRPRSRSPLAKDASEEEA